MPDDADKTTLREWKAESCVRDSVKMAGLALIAAFFGPFTWDVFLAVSVLLLVGAAILALIQKPWEKHDA